MGALGITAWIGIGCWLAAMLWLGWVVVRARRGYQDKDGFHHGRRPGEAEAIARLQDSEAAAPDTPIEPDPRRNAPAFGKPPSQDQGAAG